jgi:hypothetical protein
MVRTQISFDEELYRTAQREAARLGISLAELCRRALRRVIPGGPPTPEKKPWMRYSGIIEGGRPDESSKENIDRVVYGEKSQR